MKISEFAALCGQYLIAPEIALENEAIKDALKDRDDKRVRQLLETEF